MAFPCVPSQSGLWGCEGKSRWKLGVEAGLEQQEGPADHSLPCSPDPVALDWSWIPSLPWAWHLWLRGGLRTHQSYSEACSLTQHLLEFIRKRETDRQRGREGGREGEREGGSGNCTKGCEQKWS